MRLSTLGIVLGVGGVFFASCGGDDFTSETGGKKATGGSAGTGEAGGEGGAGTTSTGGASGTAGSTSKGGTGGSGATVGGEGGMEVGGAGADSGAGGEGGSGPPPECTSAAECDAAFGQSPCGNWACNSLGLCEARATGCTDDDRDGYGAGAQCACAALDCDDDDPQVHDNASESCYTGPTGTRGVGTCTAGNRTCAAGVWGPCAGEVVPTGEACNSQDDDCDGTADNGLGQIVCGFGPCKNLVAACAQGATGVCVPFPAAGPDDCTGGPDYDDDCDGAIDEECTTGTTSSPCFRVTPNGNDQLAAADPTGFTAFATVQAAIDYSDTHRSVSKHVCIAPGAACGVNAQFPSASNQPIVMRDGISVYGGYESGTWTRCTNSRTRLRPQSSLGVSFAYANVGPLPTVLDGVEIDRDDTPTTAGVTVDGARNVILSNIVIESAPSVMNSYGVNLVNGAQATVHHSRIIGGAGTVETIGVRSVGSQVIVQDNCLSLDAVTGRCDDFCGSSNSSIRARATTGTGIAYSVLLSSSPTSRVERSALCGNDADTGAQIRVAGNGNGIVVRGNLITARGGAIDSHGIWLEDCGGGKPWIVDNQRIEVAGDSHNTHADAIHAVGDCHPVVDSNVLIQGAGEGQGSDPTGVRCTASAGIASRCLVVDNLDIRGSEAGFPNVATGVRCENGSCVRVAGNVITGRGGGEAYGVWLQQTGALVERNLIRGGCSPTAVGLYSEDAWARLQNNRVFGFAQQDCGSATTAPSQSTGLRALTSAGLRELDVHSNFFDGGGQTNSGAACSSRAVALGATSMAPTGPNGLFRNNIFRAGTCATRYGFEELVASADPRELANDDFDPAGTPTALFFDEATTAVTTAAGVDALTGTTATATRSVDPQFTAYPNDLHLLAGSMCIDAGTTVGAPTTDMDGVARTGTPDIGPDER